MQWRIQLLGGLRAEGEGRSVTRFRTQRTAALLAYLAYHREQTHPREVLIELLWPECDIRAGRLNLRVSLSSLRSDLEPPGVLAQSVLIADRAAVGFNPAAVSTDVAVFQDALRAAERARGNPERIQFLVRAVEQYRGDLLPGQYDDWVLAAREWLAERYREALCRLVGLAEASGNVPQALDYARRLVNADPPHEESHRELIRLLAAAGQPGAALRQFRELERRLQQEYGTTPDAATYEQVREIERQAVIVGSKGHAPDTRRATSGGEEHARSDEERQRDSMDGVFSRGTQRVVLLHQLHAQPDEHVLSMLESRLRARGCDVFVDRHPRIGVEWAREIESRLRMADAVILLLSPTSAQSELLAYEMEIAREAAGQNGTPRLLLVRVNDRGPLPPGAPAALLEGLEQVVWAGPQEDERFMEELFHCLRRPRPAGGPGSAAHTGSSMLGPAFPSSDTEDRTPLPVRHPEPVGGAMPLGSPFYVVRPTDGEFHAAMARGDSLVLVKGARQMGKTSLLARGLQQAREAGARVVLSDFQKLNASHLASAETLLLTLAQWLAIQLDLDVLPQAVWDAGCGPNLNFELYLRRHVLRKIPTPLVWGLDEVDRLFTWPAGGEIFALFRSWHNERTLDPTGPWSRLTLAITYATEAHLFITDLNQSPFNVGTRLVLDDFTREQVADLNQRHGSPLRGEEEVARFFGLVSGQPYLVQRGLHEMASRSIDLAALEAKADQDQGIYGDHLRRMLVLLVKDEELCEAVRAVLRAQPCPTAEGFYRLRSAGVLAGDSAREARPRCHLYASYLATHLL